MSTQKHNSYRKVLSIQNDTVNQGEVFLSRKVVVWCIVQSTTSRTIKTSHIGFSVYLNKKFDGISAISPKSASIKIKDPLNSKVFSEYNHLKHYVDKATRNAFENYLFSLGQLTGQVIYFDKSSCKGMIKVDSLNMIIPVYACNILGAKTWYPETACMYLEKNQVIEFKYSGCGASKVTKGLFDSEKWDRIKDQSLAFRCDDNGNAITSLF